VTDLVPPFFGCARENAEIAARAAGAFAEVFASGDMLQGREVAAFEAAAAARSGRAHAVAVGSGTDALHFALTCVGVGPGDEVLTTDMSFIATASAVLRSGAKPVFADIGPDCAIDLDRADGLVGPRTRALLYMDPFGGMAAPGPIAAFASRHGLRVVEDASQSFGAALDGAPAGSVGDVGVFSFDPTKVLNAPGSGGAAVTDDPEIAARLRRLRLHGKTPDGYVEPGLNSQLPSIAAAILSLKLERHEDWAVRREALADRYDAALEPLGYKFPARPDGLRHAWQKYVLLSPERDRLRAHLAERGVPTAIHYARPLHAEPIFAGCPQRAPGFPLAEAIAARALSLPMHAHLTEAEIDGILGAIRDFEP